MLECPRIERNAVYTPRKGLRTVMLAKYSSLQLHKHYPWAEVIMHSETVGNSQLREMLGYVPLRSVPTEICEARHMDFMASLVD